LKPRIRFEHPPDPGFQKVTQAPVTPQDRAALIRKGNQLFNEGRIDDAKRIFLTVGYGDGLIRLGDWYDKKKRPLEAFRMYWLASEPGKTQAMIEKMAAVVRMWLKESEE
jgi:hypothetical protein